VPGLKERGELLAKWENLKAQDFRELQKADQGSRVTTFYFAVLAAWLA
jgi:hypothetical protein